MSETPEQYGESQPSEQQSFMRTIEALHDKVRAFVEKELKCKVTRVSISGSTRYMPPVGSIKLNSTQEDLKNVDYLLLEEKLSFTVEADSLESPLYHLHIPVMVAADLAGKEDKLILGRTTVEYGVRR